jgi:hypothetical protein
MVAGLAAVLPPLQVLLPLQVRLVELLQVRLVELLLLVMPLQGMRHALPQLLIHATPDQQSNLGGALLALPHAPALTFVAGRYQAHGLGLPAWGRVGCSESTQLCPVHACW